MYEVDYLPDGRIQRVVLSEEAHGVPWRVAKHTVMDLDEWPYPKQPLVPMAESVHERMSVEIFRGCTRGCRFCQAGMITRPVRERSITGLAATGFEEVGLLSLSSADHTEIAEISKGLADRYEGTQTGLSLPSTRVDAFNIDLANELTRNGRRSGLTFAPEGGSERIRKVINKMVSEDDLINTVAAAYGAGWRQVKLYFMCGLPTETDEDVLQIADMARRVIETGRQVSGRKDIRCTVSIGGFVPKPHTPFQWAAQLDVETTDERLRKHAADRGIAPDRIIFAEKKPNMHHLARYPLADLFLDNFPYGAHTTASDSMWMGVPILTLSGRTFASRVCSSLVSAAGIGEMVCTTEQEFIEKAVAFGNDPSLLEPIKAKLAAGRDTCLLFDTPKLVHHLEDLYRQMWADLIRGAVPVPDLRNLDIYHEIGLGLDVDDALAAVQQGDREIGHQHRVMGDHVA